MAKKAFVYDGSQWVDIAQSTADLSNYANMTTTPISGFRNAIINGDFNIWQRGTSINLTAATSTYLADRFNLYMDTNAGTVNYSRQPFTPGNYIPGNESLYFARISTGGNCFLSFSHLIEGVETFAGRTVTVSFWARTSTAKTFSTMIRQNFGVGGSAVVDKRISYTTSTSWQRFTFTFTLDSISGKTIGSSSYLLLQPIEYGASTGNFTYDIWGVQVELGPVATPFERRPIATELLMCQRYFYNNPVQYGPATSFGLGNAYHGPVVLPTTMRIPPAITLFSSSGTANQATYYPGTIVLTPSLEAISNNTFVINLPGGGSYNGVLYSFFASAEF